MPQAQDTTFQGETAACSAQASVEGETLLTSVQLVPGAQENAPSGGGRARLPLYLGLVIPSSSAVFFDTNVIGKSANMPGIKKGERQKSFAKEIPRILNLCLLVDPACSRSLTP